MLLWCTEMKSEQFMKVEQNDRLTVNLKVISLLEEENHKLKHASMLEKAPSMSSEKIMNLLWKPSRDVWIIPEGWNGYNS